jgi:hypothetical protein
VRPGKWALACFAIAAFALTLYAPALRLQLMGDDYQWVQHAHHAMHRPALLLADLDTFYRPASTWTLALDHLLWGYRPLGYHLTNLLLHGLAGACLALVGRRLGLGTAVSWVLGLLWAVSPFTEEPAASVAIRFEDLLLLAWLGMTLAWPRAGQRWSKGTRAAVAGFTALAVFSKETWVVTPGLVFALEWAYRRSEPRRALRTALPWVALAMLYVVVYFLSFPGSKNYYANSLLPLLKVPHQLAAFLFMEGLVPMSFRLSPAGMIAAVAVVGALIFAFRRRNPAAIVGAALLLLPMLPTLLVPYLPTRYTTIPYAGFLLLLAGAARELTGEIHPRWRVVTSVVAAVVVALVLTAGAFAVRADLDDLRRVSEAHQKLLVEARAALAQFPLERPVLVIREEADNPLREIITSPRGWPKLLFPRHADPYGLVDAAALFEWVFAREDVAVRRLDDGEQRCRESAGAVLAHRTGGFTWLSLATPRLGEVARQSREAGMRTRVILASRLP